MILPYNPLYYKGRNFVHLFLQFFVISSFIIAPLSVIAQTSSATYTVTGAATWTVPSCISSVTVEVWGGGGASGGDGGDPGGGTAGGGGAFSSSVISVTPGMVYNLFVGAGGAVLPGCMTLTNGAIANGGPGGNSWFVNSTTVMAVGGSGGIARNGVVGNLPGALGGQASACYGTNSHSGGNGGQTDGIVPGACCGYTSGGGGGSSAGPTGNGTNGGNAAGTMGAPGAGGVAPAGGGNGGAGTGNGGITNPGSPGAAPGGGAGGGQDHSCGAAGGMGKVMLLWSTSTFTNKTSTICSGTSFSVAPLSGTNGDNFPAGTTYSWAAPIVTGGITGGSAQAAQASISQTLTNPSATTQTATYTVTASTNCTFTITVTVNPLPTASVGGTTTVCLNSTAPVLVFTGANSTAPYTFTYNINGGTNQTISTAAGSSTVTTTASTGTAGTFTYSLTGVSDANGCSQAQTDTSAIVVNPLPSATIASSATVCQNEPSPEITFTGSGASGPYTFTYSTGGSTQTVSTTGANTTVSIAAPTNVVGNHTYFLNRVGSAAGCTRILMGGVSVMVKPLPTATVSSSTTICLNSASPDITFAGSNATAPYTFTYSLNGGTNQTISTTGTNTTISIPAPTTIATTLTYSLTSVADANGCNQPQPDSAVVVVNSLPTASLSGTVTKCLNDPPPLVSFTGASTVTPYIFTYSINGGSNQTVSTTGASTTVAISAPTNASGIFTYSLLSVQDGNGCFQTQTGSAVVTVNPLGATIAGTTSVCQNATGPLISFTGSSGTAPYTFTYNINGGSNQVVSSTGGNSTVSVTATTNTPGNLIYELTSVQDASSLSCLSAYSATITVNNLPTASIAGTTTVCFNSASPNITFTGIGTSPPYTFTYTMNGGVNQTVNTTISNSTVTVAAPTTTGVYTYSLISVQNGTAQACSQPQSGDAVVTVRQPSTATVTASTARVCQNSTSPNMIFNGSTGQPPYIFYYSTNVPIGGVTTNSVSSAPNSSVTIAVPTNTPDTIVYTITNVQDASGIICGVGGSTDSVIVDPLPVSTITAALNDVCLGDAPQTITFTGYGVPAPVTFDYYTSTNGGPNVAQTPITSVAPSLTATISAPATTLGTTLYTNGISSSNVCTGLGNGSARLTVNPIPTATISLTSASTICQSAAGQVTFTGSIGTPPFKFNYNVNGGTTQTISTASGQNSVNVPVNQLPGSYTYNLLSVSDTFNCNQAQTRAVTIVVDPLPQATAGGNSAICMNGTATVSAATAANGSINWTDNGAGTLNGITTLTPTYTAGAGDVGKVITLTMTVTSTNSCNPQTAVATYTVNVDSLPLAAAGGVVTVCQNGTATVSAAIARYGSILWTTNGAGSLTNATTLSPTYTAAAADAGNAVVLTMTVTATNSCNPQVAKATYTVNVDPLPVAVAGGVVTVCQNSSATVAGASSANGSVLWTDNGAGTLSNAASLSPSYTPAAGDAGKVVVLIMTVTATNACNPQVATATYTVNVDHLPTAVSGGSHTICQSDSTYMLVSGEATAGYGAPAWVVTTPNAGKIKAGGVTLTPTYVIDSIDSMDIADPIVLTMTVTSTNSCAAATATATYTINIDPLPVAIGGSTEICEGVVYTLKNNDVIAGNGTLVWTQNGTGSLTNTAGLTPTYASTVADAGKTVSLTITINSTNVCAPASASAVFAIVVDSLPLATAGGSVVICENASATVGGANARYGSIAWSDNGAGAITAGGNSLTPTYSPAVGDVGNPVTLLMTVTSTNTCAPKVATAVYTVIVDSLPLATTVGNATICANGSVTVSGANARYGKVLWADNGLGSISGATSLTPTYVAALGDGGNTVILSMTVTATNACAVASATASYSVIVNPVPTAFIGGTTTVCQGDAPALVTFTGQGAATPYTFTFTYQLNGGGNQTVSSAAGSSSATVAVLTATGGTFSYNLTGVENTGSVPACFNVVNGQRAGVTVNELPSAAITAPATVCQNGQAPVISFTGSNGVGPYTFFYSIGGTGAQSLSSGNSSMATVNASTAAQGSFVYELDSVVYTSGKACSTILNESVTVLVNPLPVGMVTGGAEVCVNAPAPVIVFSGSNATAPYSFLFSVNGVDGGSLLSAANGMVAYPSATGSTGTFTYSLTQVVDANGCKQVGNGSATVMVTENPVAIFTVSPESAPIFEPVVTITDNSTAASWLWDFGDGTFSAAQNPGKHRFPADTPTTYVIKLLVANGSCVDSSSQIVSVLMPLLVYVPNTFTPNGDGINDVFMPKGDGITNYSMNIYDRWGNMVFYSDDINKGWDGRANGGATIAQMDAYVYVINVTAQSNQQTYVYRGVFNLIR